MWRIASSEDVYREADKLASHRFTDEFFSHTLTREGYRKYIEEPRKAIRRRNIVDGVSGMLFLLSSVAVLYWLNSLGSKLEVMVAIIAGLSFLMACIVYFGKRFASTSGKGIEDSLKLALVFNQNIRPALRGYTGSQRTDYDKEMLATDIILNLAQAGIAEDEFNPKGSAQAEATVAYLSELTEPGFLDNIATVSPAGNLYKEFNTGRCKAWVFKRKDGLVGFLDERGVGKVKPHQGTAKDHYHQVGVADKSIDAILSEI